MKHLHHTDASEANLDLTLFQTLGDVFYKGVDKSAFIDGLGPHPNWAQVDSEGKYLSTVLATGNCPDKEALAELLLDLGSPCSDTHINGFFGWEAHIYPTLFPKIVDRMMAQTVPHAQIQWLNAMLELCVKQQKSVLIENLLDVFHAYQYEVDADKIGRHLHTLAGKTRPSLSETVACLDALAQEPGFNVDARDAVGNTPLMVSQYTQITQALLDLGANIHAKNQAGESVLRIACRAPAESNVATVLLEAGADINTAPDLDELQRIQDLTFLTPIEHVLLAARKRQALNDLTQTQPRQAHKPSKL